MASGHVNRIYRPNASLTDQRCDVKIVLANSEPSTHGMERPHVDGRLRAAVAAARTEHIGCPFLELCFPRRDLIGVDVELLRQLSQCSIALDGGKRHLGLEARCVFRRVCSLLLLIR